MKRDADVFDKSLPLTFLKVGEGDVFASPCRVETVLGSCVSVTLHCRRNALGGIFHALMPECPTPGNVSRDDVFRFVDRATVRLYEMLRAEGVRPREIEAKVFGGAKTIFSGERGVGPLNVIAALNTLARIGLRVHASDVGGNRGRKLVFLPHTGEVFVKRLSAPAHAGR